MQGSGDGRLVREPGCGCCSVCARLEGERCGVYTPRCGQGLRCYPHPGSELPLRALVHGEGTCEKHGDAEYSASPEQVAVPHSSSFAPQHPVVDRGECEGVVPCGCFPECGTQRKQLRASPLCRHRVCMQQPSESSLPPIGGGSCLSVSDSRKPLLQPSALYLWYLNRDGGIIFVVGLSCLTSPRGKLQLVPIQGNRAGTLLVPGPPESAGACSEDAGAGSPRHGRGSHTLAACPGRRPPEPTTVCLNSERTAKY
ncbi:insulin-like growth factor-binding protein 2 [Neophocaena asiaeorientalis asiaeorientalis]|uniref:Insulin-like growth factor-binding protein 2 n=1 Tax=Neophocaena asiaeorientalis asiaeorientalis TaxID=1706337 RepID=A0A341CW09_NEOAA|nr:insulin-like growth factor-binding protein 2 [Neophocaena asiaeorientalis asiaeorientalis]